MALYQTHKTKRSFEKMKKMMALLLVLVMVMSFAACAPSESTNTENTNKPTESQTPTESQKPADGVKVMTYAEYAAAAVDSDVVIEAYVQAHQDWWSDKVTVYAQDKDGGYFIYEMACSEADAAKLVAGTKIRVTGKKAEWSGEVEIVEATFEIVEGDTYVAKAEDLTSLLGTDDMIKHQNMLAAFKGLTLEKVEYRNGEPGDDIYVTVGINGASYSFCVERYLTGPNTDVYKAFETLKVGDKVDIEGFVYWYEGINTHITAISLAK